MFHELRTYRCRPGKVADELRRMKHAAKTLFPRHGMKALGYWTVLVGPCDHDLYYILEWESLEERTAKWKAFLADPEWVDLFAASEKNGPLLASISNVFLKPIEIK